MIEEMKKKYEQAISCDSCFTGTKLSRGKVSRAQPRWIGENYFQAEKKICVLMINPGDVGPKAKYSQIKSSKEFESLIEGFKDDLVSWEDLMIFILMDMHNWGQGGKYMKLYFDHLKLPLKEIAFLNIMLCSAKKLDPRGQYKNFYNQQTMRNCFNLHTHSMLEQLNPDVCILSGTAVWEFARRNDLRSLFPNCEFKELGHYAARGNDWNKAVEKAKDISLELQTSFKIQNEIYIT